MKIKTIITNVALNQFLVVKDPINPKEELYISPEDLNDDILTQDIVDALYAANSPSATNPFATIADITGSQYVELDPVLSRIPIGLAVQTLGNRYIASVTGGGWTINNIYEWDGVAWVETVPVTDNIVDVIADGFYRRYDGANWLQFGNAVLLRGGNNAASVTFGSRAVNGIAYIRADNINKIRVTATQANFTDPMVIGGFSATANSSALLDLRSTTRGTLLTRMTTAQKNSIGSPATSLLVFDTNNNQYEFWDGASWQALGGGSSGGWNLDGNTVGSIKSIGTLDAFDLPFITNNTERARILSTGEFGVGLTAPTAKFQVRGNTASAGNIVFRLQNSNPTTIFDADDYGRFAVNTVAAFWQDTFAIRPHDTSAVAFSIIDPTNNHRLFSFYNDGLTNPGSISVNLGRKPGEVAAAAVYPYATADYGSLALNSTTPGDAQIFSNRNGASYKHITFVSGAGGGFFMEQNASAHYELYTIGTAGVGLNNKISSDGDGWLAAGASQRLGVGTASPTGKLTLGGGTETLAPLVFLTGILMTTSTVGSVEYASSRFYASPITAGSRHQVKTKRTRIITAAGPATIAADDELVVVNQTVGAAITVDLPASPVDQDEHTIADGKGDAAINNITIGRNGNNINGVAANAIINTNNNTLTFRFVATYGWIIV